MKRKPITIRSMRQAAKLQAERIENLNDNFAQLTQYRYKLEADLKLANDKANDKAKLAQLEIVRDITRNWGQATDSIMRAMASTLGQGAF